MTKNQTQEQTKTLTLDDSRKIQSDILSLLNAKGHLEQSMQGYPEDSCINKFFLLLKSLDGPINGFMLWSCSQQEALILGEKK